MTGADKIMNPQHFGGDPVDIWIRIRINSEIRIRIPDHFWLTLDALAEVCVVQLYTVYLSVRSTPADSEWEGQVVSALWAHE